MKAMTLHRYRREVAHLFKYSQYGSCFNRRRWLQFFPNFCVFSISGQEKSPRCWGKVASDQPKFSWNFFSGPLGEQMCELDTCRNGAEADFFLFCFVLRAVSPVWWHPSARVEQVEQVSMFQSTVAPPRHFLTDIFGKSQMRFLRSNWIGRCCCGHRVWNLNVVFFRAIIFFLSLNRKTK